MLMGVTGRVRRLCGQRKSRLRTESIIVATSRSKPDATPILRPDNYEVDASPFAQIWPMLLSRRRFHASSRTPLVGPRGDLVERVAVHGHNLRLLPLASEPIRSAIPSDSRPSTDSLKAARSGRARQRPTRSEDHLP